VDRVFLYGLDAPARVLLALVPLVAAGGLWLARRRMAAGRGRREALVTAARDALLTLSALAIAVLTLAPVGSGNGVDLLPVVGTWRELARGGVRWNEHIAANVLLFFPFGFLLAWRLGRARWARAGLIALGVSLLVETLQAVLPINRQARVDDVLLNTVGGFLGAGAWRLLGVRPRSWRRSPTAGR
jgi:hypothetical protein